MTLLMIEVRKAFQLSFSLREFFASSSLRKFAAMIDERQAQASEKKNGSYQTSLTRDAEWARQRMAFLQREALLPKNIAPRRGLVYHTGEMNSIFMTGATGFLGAYLVAEILKATNANLYCLVRPKRNAISKERIESQMRQYNVWEEDEAGMFAWQERLQVVEGAERLEKLQPPPLDDEP